MRRDGTGNRGRGTRRLPKRPVDMERVHIVLCSVCREKITFSYGSVDKQGFRIACDLSGTKQSEEGEEGARDDSR